MASDLLRYKTRHSFLHTFLGGIHIKGRKSQSRRMVIENLSAPEYISLPLTENTLPLVKAGDYVKLGQLIATGTSDAVARLHSSVSGTVESVSDIVGSDGTSVPAIIIHNDNLDTLDESISPNKPLQELEPDEIVEIVKKAGIVGMGGAGVPAYIKLTPPIDKVIDICIANGAESEPYMTSDHRVMLEMPDKVIFGLKAIMKAVGAKKGYIAIQSNKGDAIATMRSYLKRERDIDVIPLQDKYPQGNERHLIKSVTGRIVMHDMTPQDVGVIVNNVDTCTAICDAIQKGQPSISRIVTVNGGAVAMPKNLRVRIGTPVECLINAADGYINEPVKLIIGGPMMGKAVYSDAIPVTKTTGGVVALTEKEAFIQPSQPCIRCGKCNNACPMRLQPMMLDRFAEAMNYDMLEKLRIHDCSLCGACTYVCPAKRNHVQNIILASKAMNELSERSDVENE